MSLNTRYKTDKNLEENGVWVDLGDGLRVLVARFNSKRSREVHRRLRRAYENFRGDLPEALEQELTIKQMAEGVLLGWEGMTFEDDGPPVEYSVQNAIKALTEFPDFREDVAAIALKRDNYRVQKLEGN